VAVPARSEPPLPPECSQRWRIVPERGDGCQLLLRSERRRPSLRGVRILRRRTLDVADTQRSALRRAGVSGKMCRGYRGVSERRPDSLWHLPNRQHLLFRRVMNPVEEARVTGT